MSWFDERYERIKSKYFFTSLVVCITDGLEIKLLHLEPGGVVVSNDKMNERIKQPAFKDLEFL